MFDTLIRNGKLVDGSGLPWTYADVGLVGDRIAAIGRFPHAEAKTIVDATGKVVAPGLIDAHVHGDLILLVDPLHEPAIRQGITTYILGQDGVAMAPAGPTTLQYMRRYTAGFSGNFPTPGLHWQSLDDYLSLFDRRCALNLACLVPNGNIRMEVLGLQPHPATSDELSQMRRLVRQAMEQGAVGLSSGLDYIPSLYADTDELIALCQEIAPFNGVYVTHMRGYLPTTYEAAMDEVFRIGREAGCGVHISHFNCLAQQAIPKLDAGRAAGIDVTFDLYCYLAGSSTLGAVALPPELQAGGIEATLERLRDPAVRDQLRTQFHPRLPMEKARLSSVPHPDWQQYEGQTLDRAAQQAQRSIGEFICDVLLATDLAASCVVPHHPQRTLADIVALMRHPAMMGGSDGIYVGQFPHPRGTGCYARYLGHHVRERHDWPLEEAIAKLSHHVARRHGLKDRGLLRQGLAADVIVFDETTIADRSTYDNGRALAVGVEWVWVNGTAVLQQGQRTDALPGRGLRRG